MDGEDDGGDGDVDREYGGEVDDDNGNTPERCRGPCMWVTGFQLPPTFAVEIKKSETSEKTKCDNEFIEKSFL